MRLALTYFLVGFCLTACGTNKSTVGDLAGRDLSLAPDQAGSSPQVACGGTVDSPTYCTSQKAICCSADNGHTGTCVGAANACPSGAPYQCDRPADCQAGQVCCLTYTGTNPTGSACMDAAANCNGKLLCAHNADCSGETCCAFNPGGEMSYMYCTTGSCPL